MLNILEIRRKLGRDKWAVPFQIIEYQWCFKSKHGNSSVVVSCAPWTTDGVLTEWVHASISHENNTPSYDDLKMLYDAVYTGWAYQVFAPPDRHISIHAYALHLWGRLDGQLCLPDFQKESGLNSI